VTGKKISKGRLEAVPQTQISHRSQTQAAVRPGDVAAKKMADLW